MDLARRLWTLAEGVRGRIAFSVLVGLVSATVGIARLALFRSWHRKALCQRRRFGHARKPRALRYTTRLGRGLMAHNPNQLEGPDNQALVVKLAWPLAPRRHLE